MPRPLKDGLKGNLNGLMIQIILLGDPPVSAQYALDLIFKTLVDDKEHHPYLTTFPESIEQTNSIKLELILQKYSKDYRKYLKKKRNKNDM